MVRCAVATCGRSRGGRSEHALLSAPDDPTIIPSHFGSRGMEHRMNDRLPGSRHARSSRLVLAACLGSGLVACAAPGGVRPQEPATDAVVHDVDREPDRTLRAGDGYRGRAFGQVFEGAPRDRRSVAAWDVGVATAPRVEESSVLPFGSLYFWEHPDDATLFRATVAGVVNEVFYAHSPDGWGGKELVATFESFTWPGESGEFIDGEVRDAEKLYWGYARPGIGFGYRRSIGPAQDNMLALDLIQEAGVLYFGRGDSTGTDFVVPDSTLELRSRAQLRIDLLERNLLELPHAGVAAGADLVYGYRSNWEDWGDASTGGNDADVTRDYLSFTGYAVGVTAVPFVASERHRVIGAVHGGAADGVDRFSAQRVGGGPDPRGEEYGLISRPILPGAAIGEFFPEHYAIAYAGYRYQPTFFAFIDAGASVGWLDRDRVQADGSVRREDDMLTAVGARVSSGFFGRTRFQLLYAYNFDVIRDGEEGGAEFTAHIAGYF